MQGLYPIIRRKRVPLLPMEAPAGGGQTGRGQGAVAGGEALTLPPGTLPTVEKEVTGLHDKQREHDLFTKTQAR